MVITLCKAHIIALFNADKLGVLAAEHFQRQGYALICTAGRVVDMIREEVE